MDEIWIRLKQAYGSSKILLHKKLGELSSLDSTSKSKDPDKVAFWISKIISLMKDVSKLAMDHSIENQLYNSDALNKVLKLIGESRVTRWLSKTCENDETDDDHGVEKTDKESWLSLISFLEKDLKVLQRKSMVFQNPVDKDYSHKPFVDKGSKKNTYLSQSGPNVNNEEAKLCHICGKSDQVLDTHK